METSLEKFSDGFDKPINEYSPLTLAFLGDAVYELFIRAHIVKNSNTSANMLHKKAVVFVKADAQCEAYDKIEPHLTEEEIKIFKRGRNSKVNTKAKNASLAAYKKATGFETLVGYLYVKGESERLNELFKIATDFE